MKTLYLVGILLSALAPGCLVAANDGPPVAAANSGALVVDWTIEGDNHAAQCTLSGATTVDITVTFRDGAPAGEFQQACDAFATTIDLAPGSYYASAVLLHAGGRDRTTTLQLRSFDIFGADQLSIPIDFPASSFFAP